MSIQIFPLGAGQDVGRSCVIVMIGGKTIMFDCGMHMGYNDARRFPDFTLLGQLEDYTSRIDLVAVTHFHLDHCGALPHFTEKCGYKGPIVMSQPTRAICQILLDDYRKIMSDKLGEENFYTTDDIRTCLGKVKTISVGEILQISSTLAIRAFYAGHVLGAVMFQVIVTNPNGTTQSVLYTGDYNTTPDRHLGSAFVPRIRPDVVITESTYATTIRDSKRARELDFLHQIRDCVLKDGKVLIPVFALGRAQELCVLLDTFWSRLGLAGKIPIYFSAGLTARANTYFQLYPGWTTEAIRDKHYNLALNQFEFHNISPFDRSYIRHPGPMVVFATPGMLHAGLSLEIFRAWAGDPRNLVIIPGYCVAGTVGNKVLSGQRRVEVEKDVFIDVRCTIAHLSFSAHADSNGILSLLRITQPRHAVLVHGEKSKMAFLKDRINRELNIPCWCPANGSTADIPPPPTIIPVLLARSVVEPSMIMRWRALSIRFNLAVFKSRLASMQRSLSTQLQLSLKSDDDPHLIQTTKRVKQDPKVEDATASTSQATAHNVVVPDPNASLIELACASGEASRSERIRGLAMLSAASGVVIVSPQQFSKSYSAVPLVVKQTIGLTLTCRYELANREDHSSVMVDAPFSSPEHFQRIGATLLRALATHLRQQIPFTTPPQLVRTPKHDLYISFADGRLSLKIDWKRIEYKEERLCAPLYLQFGLEEGQAGSRIEASVRKFCENAGDFRIRILR